MFYRRATVAVITGRFPAVRVTLIVLAGCLGMTGCAGNIPASHSTDSDVVNVSKSPGTRSGSSAARQAASIAEQQVGVPYRYGGTDTEGFDCSGLVYFAYSNAGTRVARTTAGLWGTLQPVQKSDLQTGDVLFFDINGKMSHVGMYLGSGRFVHAPSTGRNVVIADLYSDFYRGALVRGGRAE